MTAALGPGALAAMALRIRLPGALAGLVMMALCAFACLEGYNRVAFPYLQAVRAAARDRLARARRNARPLDPEVRHGSGDLGGSDAFGGVLLRLGDLCALGASSWNDVDFSEIHTSVTWWHAPKDANAPLSAAVRVVERLPNATLVRFGEDEGHLAAYHREGEILDELLARG